MNGKERFKYMAELFFKETGNGHFEDQKGFTIWVEKFFSELFDNHKMCDLSYTPTCTDNDKQI